MLEVIERIDAHGRDNPANPAICGKSRIVTYADFANAIANICATLEANQVERGTKTYLNIRGTDLRIASTFACLHFGLVPFMLASPDEVPGEADYDLVISAAGKFEPDIEGDVTIDGSVFDRAGNDIRSFGDFERNADELAIILASSGSTGIPKLLAMTIGQLINRSSAPSPTDRFMQTYSTMSTTFLNTTSRLFKAGGTLVRSDINPETSLRLINLFLVDRLMTTPNSIDAYMNAMDATGIKCPSLREINVGGSLIPSGLVAEIEKRFDATIIVAYGVSEIGYISGGVATGKTYKPNYAGEIVTPLGLETCENEETGETQFRVRNDPGYVLRTYRAGKVEDYQSDYFVINDIGYMEGNSVYVLGRSDEVYTLSGTKYAYSELVQLVMSVDNVVDAAVIQDPDDPDPFSLEVAVVGRNIDSYSVIDALCKGFNRRTARRHIRLFTLAELPRNPGGKVDRRALIDSLRSASPVNS